MTNEQQAALVALGEHLAAIEALKRELAPVVGDGFLMEAAYAGATFRQRFPNYWPGGQQALPLETTP